MEDLRKVKNVKRVYSLISDLTRIGKDRDLLVRLFDNVYSLLHIGGYNYKIRKP